MAVGRLKPAEACATPVVLWHLVDFRIVVVDKPFNILPGESRCPRCFGKDIVPSKPRGWRDAVMRAFGRIPRHCRFCACRFYVRVPVDEVETADPRNSRAT